MNIKFRINEKLVIKVYDIFLNYSTIFLFFITELYIAQNKLRKIEGLEGLSKLRILDLGANRIRVSKLPTCF